MKHPRKPPEQRLFDPRTFEDETTWKTLNTHDPGIFKDEDCYYSFSTDAMYREEERPPFRGGVQVRRSKDLIDWEWIGHAFDGVPKQAKEWTGADGLWAPDVIKINDTYLLYYCTSRFGTRQSFIGVASALSPEGPWTDLGEVIKTAEGDDLEVNAIDPNVLFDKDGRLWMAYGSFFGGIYILELDQQTGKPLAGETGTLLARRDRNVRDGAIEGPYIVYHPQFDYYYLFVSYDSLFTNYNVRVARSRTITGPYTDYLGQSMTDTQHAEPSRIGVKLMGGYRFSSGAGWLAPGHNSVLQDNGVYYMVHHAREEMKKSCFHLHVREISWTEEGWPLVSPERYAGEPLRIVSPSEIPGDWEWIVHDPDADAIVDAIPLSLFLDGSISGPKEGQSWRVADQEMMELRLSDHRFGGGESGKLWSCRGSIKPAWDWENERAALVFTGLTENGISLWGKQIRNLEA
ncbi:arabinan endo-1,5-alpha-L-arabinosidase [Paenibacillus sp. LHD-38]|uniref:arabinan endo-1,5-alpha-L-arabinosidase n=1 Tax=Paenibacillus sp. LHD-38 TaxID=3072143 RepID=UPI00281059FF|nr:arabinan endo-1,5-alpha-L-arabinosidase [Paenibacillus sp. LHD-38]MDQ8738979.1 arabinan endo-1,5-alpha-L-arabinosidase [Paenibacillus sp. LHD-38]